MYMKIKMLDNNTNGEVYFNNKPEPEVSPKRFIVTKSCATLLNNTIELHRIIKISLFLFDTLSFNSHLFAIAPITYNEASQIVLYPSLVLNMSVYVIVGMTENITKIVTSNLTVIFESKIFISLFINGIKKNNPT